jgi:thioredoxin 1
MLTNFKDEDFDTKIKNEDVSVIQFSAEWCGPCKALKPVMDKLSDEYKSWWSSRKSHERIFR